VALVAAVFWFAARRSSGEPKNGCVGDYTGTFQPQLASVEYQTPIALELVGSIAQFTAQVSRAATSKQGFIELQV